MHLIVKLVRTDIRYSNDFCKSHILDSMAEESSSAAADAALTSDRSRRSTSLDLELLLRNSSARSLPGKLILVYSCKLSPRAAHYLSVW